jgi:hypothetical protein
VAWTFATVYIRVRPLARGLRSILTRQSATGCTATIEFRQQGDLVLPEIPARWSSRREPLEPQIVTSGGNPQLVFKYVPGDVPQTKTLDLAPGQWEEVAVAIQRQDGTASAFGAESYAAPDWRYLGWDLKQGVYDVTVRVESSGISASRRFKLDNLKPDFARFRLTPAE